MFEVMFKTNATVVDAAMGSENNVADQPQAPNLSAIKDRQQKTWMSGNYARIGNTLVIMGELLCEAVALHAGDKVLDVATGSGNTAISAARRFCGVTGIDYIPELIEDARRRAEVEGMEITFDVGDAEDLPYPDATFDAVLSTLGVMFAPDQEKVAEELLRICRPGGKIGLANWTPDGFIGNMFRTLGKHVPPPPGIKPPRPSGVDGAGRGNQVPRIVGCSQHQFPRIPLIGNWCWILGYGEADSGGRVPSRRGEWRRGWASFRVAGVCRPRRGISGLLRLSWALA